MKVLVIVLCILMVGTVSFCICKVSFNLKQDGETYHIYRNEAGNYIVKYLYDTNNYNYAYLHDFLKGDFAKQLCLVLPQKYNRHTIIKCHNVEWIRL